MSATESEYKKLTSKKRISALQKEAETIGRRIEPYWDSNTRKIKQDAPESAKKDYKRLQEIFEILSTDY